MRMQEEKLQQLHREKVKCVLCLGGPAGFDVSVKLCLAMCIVHSQHTLETALLSASQELSDQNDPSTTATQNLVQQRDVLQNGLLSTCRELSRVNTVSGPRDVLKSEVELRDCRSHAAVWFQELDRSWREYDRLEGDVTLAKSNLLEQLEALGSPQVTHTHTDTHTQSVVASHLHECVCACLQTEPPSQRHIEIQKELWRIQDVMEALSKNKPQRSIDGEYELIACFIVVL